MHAFWAKFALFVRDLQNQLTKSGEKNIFKNCKLRIEKFQIVFSGLCEDCSKSSNSFDSLNSYQTETKQ